MTIRHRWATSWCLALVVASGCTGAPPSFDDDSVERAPVVQDELQLRLTLYAGRGPREVTIRPGAQEVVAGGPSAIALSPSGIVAVADILAGRVVRVTREGAPLPPIATPAPEHVALDADERLYVYSRRDARVSIFDPDGQQVQTIELPRTARWITGLWPWPDGTVGLHTANQESAPLDGRHVQRALREGVPGPDGSWWRTLRRGGVAWLERLETSAGDQPRASVAARFELAVPTRLGSLTIVGVDDEGVLLLDQQDVLSERPLRVERRLRRVDAAGRTLAEATLPRPGIPTPHAVALGPDGTAWALRAFDDRLEVWAWAPTGGAR